jgi:hypothetical protein
MSSESVLSRSEPLSALIVRRKGLLLWMHNSPVLSWLSKSGTMLIVSVKSIPQFLRDGAFARDLTEEDDTIDVPESCGR